MSAGTGEKKPEDRAGPRPAREGPSPRPREGPEKPPPRPWRVEGLAGDGEEPERPWRSRLARFWWLVVVLLVVNWVVSSLLLGPADREKVSYTFFLTQVDADNVREITST